jgi:hypothetical protein
MRALMYALVAAALCAACGGGSKTTPTPPPSVPARVGTPAPQSTPSACPTPPPGPVTTLQYTGSATSQTQSVLTGVQVAATACSDTATFTFSGADLPAYEAKYVQAVLGCGSGLPVTTAGSAQLTLRLEPAVAHDNNGNTTVNPPTQAPNFASIKELKSSCDFEGVVAWVIGTEEKYYTVTAAQNPSRIVVEVYH